MAQTIWTLDRISAQRMAKNIKSKFWADVVLAWAKLLEYVDDEPEDVFNYSIWNTWFIKNENLIRLQQSLIHKGCTHVVDLLSENCTFLKLQEFRQKFHVRINWFDYCSLISSIPKIWKQKVKTFQIKPEGVRELTLVQKIKKITKTTKYAYSIFIGKLPYNEKYKEKWQTVLGEISENDWKVYNAMVFRCTQNAKLQSFQYKIIHEIMGTNKVLKQCGKIPDDSCTFCKSQVETIHHLFVQCRTVKNLWNQLADWLAPYMEMRLYIMDEKCILFGAEKLALVNWLLLETKYFIHRCRIRDDSLNLEALKKYLCYEFNVEKAIAKNNEKKFDHFKKKWEPLKEIFAH